MIISLKELGSGVENNNVEHGRNIFSARLPSG